MSKTLTNLHSISAKNLIKIKHKFIKNLPYSIYSTNNVGDNIFRVSKENCYNKKYIQVNTKEYKRYIHLDLDHHEFWNWQFQKLPPPTYQMINRNNHHSHFLYELKNPIYTKNSKSYNFFKDIERGLSNRLKSDKWFHGVLCKNPFNSEWNTNFCYNLYSLNELEKYLSIKDKEAI